MLLPLQTVGTWPRNHYVRVLARGGVEPSLPNEGGDGCPRGFLLCTDGHSFSCCNPKYELCICDYADFGGCVCVPRSLSGSDGLEARADLAYAGRLRV
jgi:hypothetical protein